MSRALTFRGVNIFRIGKQIRNQRRKAHNALFGLISTLLLRISGKAPFLHRKTQNGQISEKITSPWSANDRKFDV